MNKIQAKEKNINHLLGGAKFHIDYYQREYLWGEKQISDLINDLVEAFSEESGEHYFLGSIIISEKDGKRFIVDGQQRLTSLTLLLIHLYHSTNDDEMKRSIAGLVCSEASSRISFNLEVEDRQDCMESLFKSKQRPEGPVRCDSVSEQNIVSCYKNIREEFPSTSQEILDLRDFTNWLLEKVYLVEITTGSDRDAYTVFETINDRGLRLRPTDMLKSYLLAHIHPEERDGVNDNWRKHIAKLQEHDENGDADAIKAWLRGQYAEEIRERKKGAKPKDFSRIGAEFHRWVIEKERDLGLDRNNNDTYRDFIKNNFMPYTA